jgi:hypothetical protein
LFGSRGKISKSPSLELTIKSDKQIYKREDKVKLNLSFRNNSNKEISFCRYLLEYYLFNEGIKLKGQNGDIYELISFLQLEMPGITKNDFMLIRPMKNYTYELQFDTVFPPESELVCINKGRMISEVPTGRYKITLVYSNNIDYFHGKEVTDGIPQKIHIENTWTGTLLSNTIAINIAK